MHYFTIKNTVKLFLFFLIFQCIAFAQLKKLTAPNMVSQADIYLDNNGRRYSTIITFKFKKDIINLPKGEIHTSINNITFPEIKNFLNVLIKKYGNVNLVKVIPSAVWGDTIRVNKRTGKTVYIKDMSQIFRLKFNKLVPVDSIANALKSLSIIKYAEGPVPAYLTTSSPPNDPYYTNGSQWELDKVNALEAWGITKGSSNIKISMNDQFDDLGQIHDDLVNKVVYRYSPNASGGHGIITSGVAGASTNNGIGVASLGWDTSIMFNYIAVPAQVDSAVANGADIINFSWIYYPNSYSSLMKTAIYNALKQGVICIAAAGNDSANMLVSPPVVTYPAAFNFGSVGQVIAVSATNLINNEEVGRDDWNYSPGTDPINDPTDAFIDVAAPGGPNITLSDLSSTKYVIRWGTSLSAPMVSALVSLLLAVNNSLTPQDVYTILTSTADKVGQYPYNYVNNTWNQHLGYGRINAYNALKYTLEHYGGTLTQNLTIPAGETWSFDPGVALTFQNGTSLIVNGTLNAQGTSTNPITFNSGTIVFDGSGASNSNLNYANINNGTGIQCLNGANVTIQNSTIDRTTYGVYIYNSAPIIKNNNINEPQQNGIYGETAGYQPYIYNNVITKTSGNSYYHNYEGLYFYNNSAVHADRNDVSGFYWGAYIGGSSNASFFYSSKGLYPYNRFRYNLYGIAAVWGATITANWVVGDGGNSIYSNTYYDAYSYQNSTIYGQKNYWGGGNPKQYVYDNSDFNFRSMGSRNYWDIISNNF